MNRGAAMVFDAPLDPVDELLRRAEGEMARRLGREPTLAELATGLDTDLEEIERLGSYQQVLASLDAGVGEDGETPLGALLPVDEESLEDQAVRGETERVVRAGLASLPTEEMKVVGTRFGA